MSAVVFIIKHSNLLLLNDIATFVRVLDLKKIISQPSNVIPVENKYALDKMHHYATTCLYTETKMPTKTRVCVYGYA